MVCTMQDVKPTTEVNSPEPGQGSPRPLEAIFAPRNIAVIGATETKGSVGRTVLWNLVTSPFGGTVFPVNPKRGQRPGDKSLSQHRRHSRAD